MFSDAPIRPWLERLLEDVPGAELVDVHTHIGFNDPDGFSCTPDDLKHALESTNIHGIVFPMHEPDGYRGPNDWVLSEARESKGRLTAFCRLDPRDEPLAEAERCLAAGAAGIKLHPRAEDFPLGEPSLEPVFALADERRLPVLVHAGRGIPALGKHAVELCERHPGMRLILAHAGICDLAWIWRPAQDLPNLYFDTSWWTPTDLLALFTHVPPGQVLFGSDAPYGTPAFGATMALRYGRQSGLSPEQLRAVVGAQARRLLAREDPIDAGPALGPDSLNVDPLLDRVYSFLMNAVSLMLNGVEPTESLALARLACEVGDEAPQADVCRAILALIEARDHLPNDPHRPSRFVTGLPLIVVASALAKTPDVPIPEVALPAAADVGERQA